MELKPQPVQEKFLASPADIAIFGGSAGSGKALHIETPIPTPDGWRLIGDIVTGDSVFDENGLPCIVTLAHDIYTPDKAYRLTFDDGSIIEACGDHLWLTFTADDLTKLTQRDPEWQAKRRAKRPSRATGGQGTFKSEAVAKRNTALAEAKRNSLLVLPVGCVKLTSQIADTLTVRNGTRLNHAIPVCKAWQLPEVELPIDPYLLGLWLGDGTTTSGGMTTADQEIIDAFTEKGFECIKWKAQYGWGIRKLHAQLRDLGVSGNKHIPEQYLRASFEQRLALAQGLFDTDGYAKPSGNTCEYYSTLKHLAEQAFELVISLGCKAVLREKRSTLNGKYCGQCYVVAFSTDIPMFRLKRKLESQSAGTYRRTNDFRYIKSCEQITPVPMRCLTVDSPSRLYLCGKSAIPTHNSYALLMEPLRHINNPNFGGVIFRREAKQINNEGGLRDTALTIYPGFGGRFRSQPTPMFNFPSGARITFEHLNQESDVSKWQGSQVPFIAYDELCHFSEAQFWYMLSRNRSTCGVRPYVRGTCNPDPDSWVAKFIEWWIDSETGYPIDSRSGKLRYFLRQPSPTGAVLVWASSPHAVLAELNMERPPEFELKSALQEIDDANAQGEDIPDEVSDIILYAKTLRSVRSATFVPAKIYDNPALLSKDPGYLANLKAQSRVERGRLLDGNWKIRAGGGLYFPSLDAKFVETLPTTITRWIRSWDLAATEPTEEHDPDWTVGMKLGRRPDGMIVIVDVIRIRRNARFVREIVRATAEADGKQTYIRIPQDPGQAGREQADSYRDMLRGFNLFTRVVTKNKTIMAEPVAAEWQRGRVALLRAPWNKEVLAELEQFPDAKHDDVVDALSGGYSLLLPNETPDYSAGGLSRRYR